MLVFRGLFDKFPKFCENFKIMIDFDVIPTDVQVEFVTNKGHIMDAKVQPVEGELVLIHSGH